MSTEAYPLQWPPGWKRTSADDRKPAQFRAYSGGSLPLGEAIGRLREQIRLLSYTRGCVVEGLVISSDLKMRKRDGLPLASQRKPDDPGVAVYFLLDGAEVCMPCDRYDRIADNVGAVAAAIDALRALERHGSGEMLRAAFTGFKALPARASGVPWYETLGIDPEDLDDLTRDELDRVYRLRASETHPDKPGNELEGFLAVQRAREHGLALLRGRA